MRKIENLWYMCAGLHGGESKISYVFEKNKKNPNNYMKWVYIKKHAWWYKDQSINRSIVVLTNIFIQCSTY